MSSEADGLASGNEPALPVASDISSADFGLIGSPDINARKLAASLMWAGIRKRVNALRRSRPSRGRSTERPEIVVCQFWATGA